MQRQGDKETRRQGGGAIIAHCSSPCLHVSLSTTASTSALPRAAKGWSDVRFPGRPAAVLVVGGAPRIDYIVRGTRTNRNSLVARPHGSPRLLPHHDRVWHSALAVSAVKWKGLVCAWDI